MSVAVTKNVKPDSGINRPHRLLADPERLKKEVERERRITRLKQVREKSKTLARKIREDVAAEQTRQIKKLEETKQKEVTAWREHVMAKKLQDYRTSMFHVGDAHRAALVENEKATQEKQLRNEKIKKCRGLASKQMAKRNPTTVLRVVGSKDLNVEGRATTATQTPVDREQGGKENKKCNNAKSHSSSLDKCKKRSCCCGKTNCQHDKEHYQEEHNQNAPETYEISSDECDLADAQTEQSGGQLRRTPPVILDVDVESEDSLENCSANGIEINDRHMQTNRKFSRVVRPSPTHSPERPPVASRPRFTQISDLVRRTSHTTAASSTSRYDQQQEPPISRPISPKTTVSVDMPNSPRRGVPPKPSSTRSGCNQPQQRQQQLPPAKVIDAGIRRSTTASQKAATTAAETLPQPQNPRQLVPQKELPPATAHMQEVPHLQQLPMAPPPPLPGYPNGMYPAPFLPGYAPMMPFPMQPYPLPQYAPVTAYPAPAPPAQPQTSLPATRSGTRVAPTTAMTTQKTPSTSTYTVGQKSSTKAAESSTTGRVQFYDHNNKYQSNYQQPEQAVQVNLPDKTHLNAMDHARIETQLGQLREQELEKLRKVSEQRGQKALQREQVRRDCAELTEKLEALAQQQPQLLPSDANFIPSHRFADIALRREQKMNEAMEEMLLRPAIVTCPEVSTARSNTSPRKPCAPQVAVNVGAPPVEKCMDDAVSTASCCSMLLDYVDDQRKQLRTELRGMNGKSTKSIKLKNLLQRIEKIRSQLLTELNQGEMDGDNVQRVIESIRQERADMETDAARKLDEREINLLKKEALLEQRVRQLYKQQLKLKNQHLVKTVDDKPVEIVIKVKGDGVVNNMDKSPTKCKKKPQLEGDKPTTTTSSTSRSGTQEKRLPIVHNLRQNSIDSTSTIYRELPSVNYENIRAAPAVAATTQTSQVEPLHPIVAHYVDRLLNMSGKYVDQLSVSSTDVTTPSASIINLASNMSHRPVPDSTTLDETLVNNQHMERVEAFIEENRTFINEVRDSLASHQEEILEQQKPQKAQPWKNRLGSARSAREDCPQPQSERAPSQRTDRSADSQKSKSDNAKSRADTARSLVNKLATQLAINEQQKQQPSTSKSVAKPRQPQTDTSSNSKSQSSSETYAPLQMERFAKLTENCTQRIAELTDLITKVREEKQRLVEVTLTSGSEGERHSTEYFELPAREREAQQRGQRTISERSEGQESIPSNSEALPIPLQKHKPTGASLDSGISVSRPVTAMGAEPLPLDGEPLSLGSSTPAVSQRRGKAPPATIRRYSPQLADEEVAHELSTITEVDTPGQSHMLAPAAAPAAPIPFPTFAEYIKEMRIDITQVDADQSLRLHHEYHELLKIIKANDQTHDYRDFPSIFAYLQNVSHSITRLANERSQVEQRLSSTTGDFMHELRLTNVTIQQFPNRRDYLEQRLANEPSEERDLIDSGSLDSHDSLNVEEELKKRRLLKSSFRRAALGEMYEMDVASSTRRESIPQNVDTLPNESGIAPLTRSLSDRQPISMRERSEKRNSSKRIAAGGSPMSSSSQSLDAPQDVSKLGHTLNIRELLMRELLSEQARSDSESSDVSVRSNFLQSVMDSLSSSSSPHTQGVGHATSGTNQKTSTPVGSLLSTTDRTNSSNELFSVSSRISAVNYADGTPPVPHDVPSSTGATSKIGRTPNRHMRKTSLK